MDPQATLARIVEIVLRSLSRFGTPEDRERDWSDQGNAFEDLAEWLRKGGFPPAATGPIFGRGRYDVIRHIKDRPTDWRYAIMTTNPNDDECRTWRFVEYTHSGEELRHWVLPRTPGTKE